MLKTNLKIKQPFDMVSVLDANGIAKFISPEHSVTLGYAAEELLGQCVFDYVHPDDVQFVIGMFRVMVETNKPTKVTFRFRRKTGDWVHVHSKGLPFIEKGEPQGFIIVSTEQHDIDLVELLKRMDSQQLSDIVNHDSSSA